MSIILEGIDLPTDRKPYGIEVIYRFEGADGLFSEKNYLSPNQAVQIPKGHGRIIDEDEAFENVACFHGTAWLDTEGIEALLEAEENDEYDT